MIKLFIIGLFLTSLVYADEVISTLETEETQTNQINEELRQLLKDIQANADDISNAVPSGVIVMWSGAISNIPSGWVICDGNNGTPNLTDRFVIHADADSGGTNDVGDTGGEHSHALTEAEMPSHQHEDGGAINTGHDGPWGYTTNYRSGSYAEYSESGGCEGNEHRQKTSYVGGDSAHENRPKFYALSYIMKN